MADQEKADYVEIAIGGVDRRGVIAPFCHLTKQSRYKNKEIYRSYFFYNEAGMTSIVEGESTVSSYDGPRFCRDIHLDFDGDTALGETRNVVNKLVQLNVPPQFIKVYFSGSKGFHVWMPDIFGFESPEECKRTLQNHFPKADMMPVHKNGLIRVPGTLNAKSDLFKTEIGKDILYDVTMLEVLDLAKERDEGSQEALMECLLDWEENYGEHILADLKVKERKVVVRKPGQAWTPKKTGYLGCITSMFDTYPADGTRHQVGLRMVTAYMGTRNLSKDEVMPILDKWVEPNPPKEGPQFSDKLTTWAANKKKAEGVLRHHDCLKDPLMRHHCVGSSCPIYKLRDRKKESTTMRGAMDKYRADIDANHGGFNLNEIYPGINYSFKKRDIGLLAGDTKIGKSTLFNNWAVHIKHLRWLFITPEMDESQMFERTLQIERGLVVDDKENIDQVADLVISLNGDSDELLEGIDHIRWMTSSMETKEIRNMILSESPDVVVIDPYESISEVIDNPEVVPNVLRDITNQSEIIMLLVHHINKSGQKELGLENRIKQWMLKGHKRIQEQCNHLIGFSGSHSSPVRAVYTMATRRNQDFDIYLEGDPRTFRFELSEIE